MRRGHDRPTGGTRYCGNCSNMCACAGGTIDQLVAPVIPMMLAPLHVAWAFECEEACRNTLLALRACVALCAKLLEASQPPTSLLHHAQFHAQLARTSLRVISHLRRELAALVRSVPCVFGIAMCAGGRDVYYHVCGGGRRFITM
jgi:hypothetical protein